MDFEPSSKSRDVLGRVKRFMGEEIEPVEARVMREMAALDGGGDWRAWKPHPVVEELKAKAKGQGLWNLFLPDPRLGAGLTTLEYAPIAEAMGRSFIAPEVFNCNAPDTGNMEVLCAYGSDEQKRQWLEPLLAGEIRSVFCMTEPDVASSDATNMQATAVVDGDEVVLNGNQVVVERPRRSARPGGDLHGAHARSEAPTATTSTRMVLVPLDTPGVTIERMLPVFGDVRRPARPRRGALRGRARAAGQRHRRTGAGLRDRAGPARPRPHPPLHALHRRRRAGAGADDRPRHEAHRLRQAAAQPGRQPRARGRGAHRHRPGAAAHAVRGLEDRPGGRAGRDDRDLGHQGGGAQRAAAGGRRRHPDPRRRGAVARHAAGGFFAQARALRLADGPDEVHKGLIARIELAKRGFDRR